jgi:folate-binding protein YgfZ
VIIVVDDERIVVETAADRALELLELLDRYCFAERLELAARDDAGAATLVGPRAPAELGLEPGRARADGAALIHAGSRHGVGYVRVLGDAAALGAFTGERQPLPPALAEALRIALGEVRVGIDTDRSTLGPEAPIADHLSTTKGCYTGQEIVARIETYGHVNRALVLVRVDGVAPIPSGTMLHEPDGGAPVGRVTSAAPVAELSATIAIATVPAAFTEPGTALRVGAADGPIAVVERFGISP